MRHERQGSTFLVHILNVKHVYHSSELIFKLSNPHSLDRHYNLKMFQILPTLCLW